MRDEVRPEVLWLFDPAADPDLVMDFLEEQGFKNPDGAYESLLLLRDGPQTRPLTQRARRHLERIAPLLLQEVLDSPRAGDGAAQSGALPRRTAGAGDFLCPAGRKSRDHHACWSPSSAPVSSSRASSSSIRKFSMRWFAVPMPWPIKEQSAMEVELTELARPAADYEEQLDILRRFRNEEIVAHRPQRSSTATPAGGSTGQLSFLADTCLKKALDIARDELLAALRSSFLPGRGWIGTGGRLSPLSAWGNSAGWS